MDKGLSKLQKTILILAYQNRLRDYSTGGVNNSEVLIEVYKFPSHLPSAFTTSGSPQIFKLAEIGYKKYRSASVSVVKAFNRLAKRGLAIRKYNHGIVLTDEGVKVAKVLIKNFQS